MARINVQDFGREREKRGIDERLGKNKGDGGSWSKREKERLEN